MNLRTEQKVKFWLFIITKTLAMVLVIYKLIDLFIDKQVQGAIGPYNQAIEIGQIVFVSGQLPVHVDTGMPTTIKDQTRQVLENLGHV